MHPRIVRVLVALLAAAALPLSASAGAVRPGGAHHAPSDGALPASSRNVELVGSIELTDTEGGIGDVGVLGTHAYLAGYAGECYNQSPASAGPGIHVVDFSIPQLPRKVAFIPSPAGSFTGEGVMAMRMNTKSFTGDVLLVSLETCTSSARYAGVALYDVSDPTAPVTLAIGKGDRSPKPSNGKSAHATHSAFMWQAGKRAYAVLVDNEEGGFRDVDIMEITNPRRPKLIAETGMASWRGVNGSKPKQKQLGGFGGSFHHDMWVKKIGKKWFMLVSYWDSGWVVLDVTNPRKPRYVKDSNYPKRDKLTKAPTEGNAHQAVWSHDNRYIIGANEDLFAKFTFLIGGRGEGAWFSQSTELRGAPTLARDGFGAIQGPTIYAGLGCPPFGIPSPASAGQTKPGELPIAVLQDGVCDVADKVNAAEAAGYRMVILASSHETAQFGTAPESQVCGEQKAVRIHVACLGHRSFHRLFGSEPNYVEPLLAEPQVGARGDYVQVVTFADGTWGDLNLVKASSMRQIDQYQVPEGLDPAYLDGAGALSIHEIKLDPRRSTNIVYASWYGAGLRVLTYGKKGIREVGHYTDGTQDYWGVYPVAQSSGPPLVLMSDMNHGLVILRYTG